MSAGMYVEDVRHLQSYFWAAWTKRDRSSSVFNTGVTGMAGRFPLCVVAPVFGDIITTL